MTRSSKEQAIKDWNRRTKPDTDTTETTSHGLTPQEKSSLRAWGANEEAVEGFDKAIRESREGK